MGLDFENLYGRNTIGNTDLQHGVPRHRTSLRTLGMGSTSATWPDGSLESLYNNEGSLSSLNTIAGLARVCNYI
jgi:hypothetical protein